MAQKDNHSFYKKAINTYGITARGVHWNSEFSQYKRFEILTKFIKNEIKNSSIIDAGCGFGEYYNYLFDNNLSPKSYIGFDCEEKMVKIASKRFINSKFFIKNILSDKLPFADYYICSGALSILTKEEIYKFINNCFQASEKAFIFNFLKDDPLTNIKVSDVLSYCKTLTKDIKIEENYLKNDISIYLKK